MIIIVVKREVGREKISITKVINIIIRIDIGVLRKIRIRVLRRGQELDQERRNMKVKEEKMQYLNKNKTVRKIIHKGVKIFKTLFLFIINLVGRMK